MALTDHFTKSQKSIDLHGSTGDVLRGAKACCPQLGREDRYPGPVVGSKGLG